MLKNLFVRFFDCVFFIGFIGVNVIMINVKLISVVSK